MALAICYKTKTPVVYNKGTKWETSCDTFLARYFENDIKKAQAEIKRLNTEKPDRVCKQGMKIDWDKIEYFFLNEQEEMY